MSVSEKPIADSASSGSVSSAVRGMSCSASVRDTTGSQLTATLPMFWKVQCAAVSTTRGTTSVPEQWKRPSGWWKTTSPTFE